MQRFSVTPRSDWKQKVSTFGFEHHTYADGTLYWDESAYYSFHQDEAEVFFSVARQLYRALIDIGGEIVTGQRYDEVGIPLGAIPLLARSWEADDPTVLCRLDFLYNGTGAPRLLTVHADTPGMLLESAHVQWNWKEECFPEKEQFNSIYETLLDTFREYGFAGRAIHFSTPRRGITPQFADMELLREVAREIGVRTRHLKLSEVNWDDLKGRFVDPDGEPIDMLMKLYPWEWLLTDLFGKHLLTDTMVLIEPAWKILLANQAILAMLTRALPDEENIVPVSMKSFGNGSQPVSNFRPRSNEAFTASHLGTKDLAFDTIPLVYRGAFALPDFKGNFPLVSCWLIGGHPAALAVRENNRSDGMGKWRFIPHVLDA